MGMTEAETEYLVMTFFGEEALGFSSQGDEDGPVDARGRPYGSGAVQEEGKPHFFLFFIMKKEALTAPWDISKFGSCAECESSPVIECCWFNLRGAAIFGVIGPGSKPIHGCSHIVYTARLSTNVIPGAKALGMLCVRRQRERQRDRDKSDVTAVVTCVPEARKQHLNGVFSFLFLLIFP